MTSADSQTGQPRVIDDGAAIEVELSGERYRFHACWLRDNAQDSDTRDPINGQRLITLLDVPADTRIDAADWTPDGFRIRFEPEGKTVTFDPDWLRGHVYDGDIERAPGWTSDSIMRWDASLGDRVASADYPALRDDPGARLRWLKAIVRDGVARVRGGTPEQIAALFGFVRETNYGRVFDVRIEARPSNLAYTNLGLQAHTDNPYRDPVPGLQILCCVHNDVSGGDSVLVDGFQVAQRLQDAMPDGFALLARYPANFTYAGARGVRLRAKRPIIELGVDGELLAIRFNNRSAAPFVDVPYDRMPAYYRAYRRFAELVEDPALIVRFKLTAGEAFVADNLRLLHGRTAISGSGARHLQGCYADRDGLLSTIAALEQEEFAA